MSDVQPVYSLSRYSMISKRRTTKIYVFGPNNQAVIHDVRERWDQSLNYSLSSIIWFMNTVLNLTCFMCNRLVLFHTFCRIKTMITPLKLIFTSQSIRMQLIRVKGARGLWVGGIGKPWMSCQQGWEKIVEKIENRYLTYPNWLFTVFNKSKL